MDITVAISRTTIFLLVYTPILSLPFLLVIWLKSGLMQWFGQWWWVSPLVLMFSLATTGPFIYIFLQRKVEERLLKEQKLSPYVFRHSSATHWLDAGARKKRDILAYVQRQLGHESLESTAIYTHVAIEPLR